MTAPLVTRIREKLRDVVILLRRQYFIRVWGMDIGEGTSISMSAKLDKTNPRGVHIGKYTVVTFGAAVLAHDYVNQRDRDVYIGDDCFIGAHSIIGGCAKIVQDVPPFLVADGNQGLNASQALDFVQRLAKAKVALQFLEQPFPNITFR